ncbi:DUF86 domain-containing protein [bacterium]|nr:DUF86 domain-containing protein [bacterium]
MQDILDAIAKVEKYAPQADSIEEDLLNSLVARQLEINGEAVYRLPRDLRSANPQVPWNEIAAVRHIIVHDYWELDYARLWEIVLERLPQLKADITAILESLS